VKNKIEECLCWNIC